MPLGPGKYDDLCTMVREKAKAQAAIVLVINGNKGSGFAVQADLMATMALPELLENIAASIRASHKEGKA